MIDLPGILFLISKLLFSKLQSPVSESECKSEAMVTSPEEEKSEVMFCCEILRPAQIQLQTRIEIHSTKDEKTKMFLATLTMTRKTTTTTKTMTTKTTTTKMITTTKTKTTKTTT